MYQLFGYRQSGSAAVEIALDLCDVAYRRVDAYSTQDSDAAKALEALNPQKQVPTLQLPDGSVLTEAAAILIHLGLNYPASKLLPDDAAQRAQAIRGAGLYRGQLLHAHRHHRFSGTLAGRCGRSDSAALGIGHPATAVPQLGAICRPVPGPAVSRRCRAGGARYPGGGDHEVEKHAGGHAERPSGVLRIVGAHRPPSARCTDAVVALAFVGAVERSEAAIFALTLESQAKDQKIAAFGSSYRSRTRLAYSRLLNQVDKLPDVLLMRRHQFVDAGPRRCLQAAATGEGRASLPRLRRRHCASMRA